MKKLFLLVMLCGFTSAAMAQFIETVHLKNGSMIRGTIIEQIPNQSIKIQTRDGNVFVYSNDEIEKIVKEIPKQQGWNAYSGFASARSPYTPKTPSYMGTVDFGYSIDMSDYDAGRIEFSTSHGCLIIPYLYVGAGFGFQYYHSASAFTVPIFGDFRGFLAKGNVKPFLNFRIGYAVGDLDGLYLSPSIGVSINRFDISFGYSMQRATIDYYGYYYNYEYSENLGALTFKMGFRF